MSVNVEAFCDILTSNTITRPADTTAYASGDLVANSTTAGSVTPFSFTNAVRFPGGSVRVERCRIQKSGTSTTNAAFRVHIYSGTPASIANGDNGAWSTSIVGYVGAFDVTLDRAFTNGAEGAGLTLTSTPMTCKTVGSAITLYALIEARGAYTPASAETFTILLEAYRF
jgi:hypothetical protein